jgi:hypothetical protein
MKDGGTALKWGIGIMIYLIIYFFIVLSVSNGLIALKQTTTLAPTDVFGAGLVDGCGQPRMIYNTTYSGDAASSLKCGYINTGSICDGTSTCLWTNSTDGYFCAPKTTNVGVSLAYLYYSEASIPKSYQAYTYTFKFDTILVDTAKEGTTFWIFDKQFPISLSSTPRLSGSKEVCEAFGFTWYDSPTYVDTVSDWGKIRIALSTMFGFDYSFCNSDDTGCKEFYGYFSKLFAWIPFIALLVCLYLLIPLI